MNIPGRIAKICSGIWLTFCNLYGIIILVANGEVSERFKELVLKTSDSNRAVGSNPTLSAITFHYN